MTSREIITTNAFLSAYFDKLLVATQQFHSLDYVFHNGDYHPVKIDDDNLGDIVDFDQCKVMFQLLDDSVGDIILERFKEIPLVFHNDLFVINQSLSDSMKTKLYRAHFNRVPNSITRGTIIKFVGEDSFYEFFLAIGWVFSKQKYVEYPTFFEEVFRMHFERHGEVPVNIKYVLNFSENFFAQTFGAWHAPDEIRQLCKHKSVTFINRYIVPFISDTPMGDRHRSRYINAFFDVAVRRRLLSDEVIIRLLKNCPWTYIGLFPKILKKETFLVLKEVLFDRLEYDEKFAAQFTYEIFRVGMINIPFSSETFERTDIPYWKIVKATFVCYLMSKNRKDETEGALEQLVTENYELISLLEYDDDYFGSEFYRENFSPEFYWRFQSSFSEEFWEVLARKYGNLRFWRNPTILEKVRSDEQLRIELVGNPVITLDIIQALGELSIGEVLTLASNPLTVQKALDEEKRIAEHAESLGQYLEEPMQRALTGLREARSLYPR